MENFKKISNGLKILSLGLDNSILNKSSVLAQRAIEYGSLVEKYSVIVPSQKNEKVELSEKVYPFRNSSGALNLVVEQRSIISNGVKVYGSGGGGKSAQFIKIYSVAIKLLREEKYDIITVQDQYYLALIGLCLAKKFKLGLEIQVHGFEKYYGLRKLIAKYVLPKANAVRCVSQRLKKRLINKFGVDKEKITVVPIYSECRMLNVELRIKKDAEKFIFLTVGRLVPIKNIGLQIEAMKEVAKKYPNTELWIIGDGPEKENYELNSNIKMLGWQNNLINYYNQADAFVLTSNYEGWGMAVIEAAGFGLPIIMTDVGCAGEVIKNGENGIVIPVGDKQKLVEAMMKIIADENLRKKIGENAKSAVSRLPGKGQTLELFKKSWKIATASKL